VKLYRIKDWAAHFENNRTKELKTLTWVPFSNKHDGDGYTALMIHKNGEALFGAFVAIVQVASKCDPRGTLLRGPAMPHSAASLARMTRFSERTIQQCLDVCSGLEIGWISCENTNENRNLACPRDIPACKCGGIASDCLEGKGREWKGKEGEEPTPPPFYSEARIILHWLNEKSGSHFREVDTNLSAIAARLKSTDGDVEGVKLMVERQCRIWKGDPKTEEWLRPSTLFGPDKFETYYGKRNQAANGAQIATSKAVTPQEIYIDQNLKNKPFGGSHD
jgi:uncharacterized phage protein (TIGR02220 family)